MGKYTIGIDFGTLSARAVLLDIKTGEVIKESACDYLDGVIEQTLPNTSVKLKPDWCLQNPNDYLASMVTVVNDVSREVITESIVGLAVDFTACTVMPVFEDGQPLMNDHRWEKNPHAWPKLWKHHAAQKQADQINQLAEKLAEPWFPYYGKNISSEWLFPKLLQIVQEDEELYDEMAYFIEAGDWLTWQLTGKQKRSKITAGFKAMWQEELGFPNKDFFGQLHPKLADVVGTKIPTDYYSIGTPVGTLLPEMARKLKLSSDVIVAVGNIDAHVCVAATKVTQAGQMLNIIGTSSCDIFLSDNPELTPNIAGFVKDGALPGLYAYETGQSAVGDILSWYIENGVPHSYYLAAQAKDMSIYSYLEMKARGIKASDHGLVVLDWWNGNRSILMNANLTGVILGLTLETKPEEIYRAIIEATAFGKRIIIDNFEKHHNPINELVFCGGLPTKNKLFNQIYANVLNKPIKVSHYKETGAVSSALFAAVAFGSDQGGFSSIEEAVEALVANSEEVYFPEEKHVAAYQLMYENYQKLHDYFGIKEVSFMEEIKVRKGN